MSSLLQENGFYDRPGYGGFGGTHLGGAHHGSSTSRESASSASAIVSGSGNRYDDAAYYDMIEQYKNNPDLYKKLLQNPWLFSKQAQFSPSLIQQIGQAFGDYSAFDSYYSQIQSNQQQWLSEVLEAFRQQDYDSPAAQVERERAAGINPEIANNITPGSAAENDQPMMPGASMQMNDGSDILKITEAGYSLVQNLMSMYGQFQTMRGANLDNAMREMSLYNKGSQNALDWLVHSLPSDLDFNTDDFSSLSDVVLDAVEKRSNDLPYLSRKSRKFIGHFIGNFKATKDNKPTAYMSAMIEELKQRYAAARKSAAYTASDPGFDKGFMEYVSEIGQAISIPARELAKKQISADKAQADYTANRLSGSLGKEEREAASSSAKMEVSRKDSINQINQVFDKISGLSNGDKWYHVIGKFLAEIARSALISQILTGHGLPSVNINSAPRD